MLSVDQPCFPDPCHPSATGICGNGLACQPWDIGWKCKKLDDPATLNTVEGVLGASCADVSCGTFVFFCEFGGTNLCATPLVCRQRECFGGVNPTCQLPGKYLQPCDSSDPYQCTVCEAGTFCASDGFCRRKCQDKNDCPCNQCTPSGCADQLCVFPPNIDIGECHRCAALGAECSAATPCCDQVGQLCEAVAAAARCCLPVGGAGCQTDQHCCDPASTGKFRCFADKTCKTCLQAGSTCAAPQECCSHSCAGKCLGGPGEKCGAGADCASGKCVCGLCDAAPVAPGQACPSNASGPCLCQLGSGPGAICEPGPGGPVCRVPNCTAWPAAGLNNACAGGENVEECNLAKSGLNVCCGVSGWTCNDTSECCKDYLCDPATKKCKLDPTNPNAAKQPCGGAVGGCLSIGQACGKPGQLACCSDLACLSGTCAQPPVPVQYTVLGFEYDTSGIKAQPTYAYTIAQGTPVAVGAAGMVWVLTRNPERVLRIDPQKPQTAVSVDLPATPGSTPENMQVVEVLPGPAPGARVEIGGIGRSDAYLVVGASTLSITDTKTIKYAGQPAAMTVAISPNPPTPETGIATLVTSGPSRMLQVNFLGQSTLANVSAGSFGTPRGVTTSPSEAWVAFAGTPPQAARFGIPALGAVPGQWTSFLAEPAGIAGADVADHEFVVVAVKSDGIKQAQLRAYPKGNLAAVPPQLKLHVFDGQPVVLNMTAASNLDVWSWVATTGPNRVRRVMTSNTAYPAAVLVLDSFGEPVDMAVAQLSDSFKGMVNVLVKK